MELTRSARPWLCRIFAVLVVVFSAASVVRAEDIYDEEKVIESDSFLRLRKNLRSVMNSVDPEVVDAETNRELQSAFDRMFESFESQTLETLQPADEKKRRLPFGLLHRRAHEIIDNADLPPGSKALGTLHRSIHHVFSSSFSPDACYPKFAANHTGCLERRGVTGCVKVKRGLMNADDKRVILEAHNEMRSRVARGQVRMIGDDDDATTLMPTAGAMAKMVWDEELAYLAQSWADQCNFTTDCDQCRRTDRLRFVGQNLLRFRGLQSASFVPRWSLAVGNWVSSRRDLPPGVLSNYTHDDTWASFTQMIWDFTYLVGCGFASYEEPAAGGGLLGRAFTHLYICNYGPAGNVLGTPVYEVGDPCSKCPPSTSCDKVRGLCDYEEDETPAGFIPSAIDNDHHQG